MRGKNYSRDAYIIFSALQYVLQVPFNTKKSTQGARRLTMLTFDEQVKI